MKYVDSVESVTLLERMVIQELKNLGIKVPKSCKRLRVESATLQPGSHSVVFGNSVANLPCVDIDVCGPVPKFLVDVCQIIEKGIDIEGIFRKSGSVMRQKELRTKIESNHDISEASPTDLASLLKQFIRELPEPLLTFRLQDAFVKCQSLAEPACKSALFLLCSILPTHHLSTLRFLMTFFSRVAERAMCNKMDASNLALCLTPNVFRVDGSSIGRSDVLIENKTLQSQTAVVQILIEGSGMIGMISEELAEDVFLRTSCLSDSDAENAGETDKERKRNGIMTNLSNSFTKWRNKDKQNSSVICSASNQLSINADNMGDVCPDSLQHIPPLSSLSVEGTPLLMRKRKANTEVTPFSAGKKKAILRNMPQMSAIGVASFTPGNRRDVVSEPCELLSSQPTRETATKEGSQIGIRRTGSFGQSPSLSLQTPSKNRLRKSLEGFMRRLSGGRETQDTQKDVDFVETTAEGVRTSVYHKSPSSPAFSSVHHSDTAFDDNNSYNRHCDAASPQSETLVGHSDLGTLPGCPTPLRTKSISEDSSFNRSCGLKRGKPNTVKTGLPSPMNRRSLDVANETRSILNNEAIKVRRNSVAVIDTSPINGDRVSVLPMHHGSPRILKELKRQLTFQASSASLVSMETDCASPENGHDCAFIDFANEINNSPTTDPCIFNLNVTSDNELDVVNSHTNTMVASPQLILGTVSSSELVLSHSDRQTANCRLSNGPVILSLDSGMSGTIGFSEIVEKPCTELKSVAVVDKGLAQSHNPCSLDSVSSEKVILPRDGVALNTVSDAVVLQLSDCSTLSTSVSDGTLLQVNGRTVCNTRKGHDRLGYTSPRRPTFAHLAGGVSSGTLTPKRLPRLLDPVERFVSMPSPGKPDGSATSKSTSWRDPMPESTMLSSSNGAMTPVPKIKQPLITGSAVKKTTLSKRGSGMTDGAVRKKRQLLLNGNTRCDLPLKNLPRNNL